MPTNLQEIFSSIDPDTFNYVILPMLIFFSRIIDVSMGTVRIILTARGKKYITPFLGFIEVLLFLLVITQVMKNLNNIFCYLAYAGGFASGTFIGMLIEEKIAIGDCIVTVIVPFNDIQLYEKLIESGFGVTMMEGQGSKTDVKIIMTLVKRKKVNDVISLIKSINPNAFYSIENAKTSNRDYKQG